MRLIDADKLKSDCLTNDGHLVITQSQIAAAETVGEERMTDFHGEILALAKETEEDLIFTRISRYMEREYNRATFAISKQMLFRALECFEQEHPEEWEQLKSECKGMVQNERETS